MRYFLVAVLTQLFVSLAFAEEHNEEFLEKLGYKYGSDKSKDDHNYVAVYSTLFDHRRKHVVNMTEIGVSAGQSLQMWHDYFPVAQIYGLDIKIKSEVRQNLAPLRRIHLIEDDAYSAAAVRKLGFVPESMDLIIDDALHSRKYQESLLPLWWPYLKPGGYYVMEDLDARKEKGGLDFQQKPSSIKAEAKQILRDNHVMYMDTHLGHRNWDTFIKGVDWNHKIHNSYLIVIRKRIGAIPPVLTNRGSVAMKTNKLVSSGPERKMLRGTEEVDEK